MKHKRPRKLPKPSTSTTKQFDTRMDCLTDHFLDVLRGDGEWGERTAGFSLLDITGAFMTAFATYAALAACAKACAAGKAKVK